MNNENSLPKIAILGGTGKEGKGLAYRWSKAGYAIIIGSRSYERALSAVADLKKLVGNYLTITGMENLDAARESDIIVLSVPFSAHQNTLEHVREALKGKILIDVTVPLMPPKVSTVQMPPAGSAAQEAQKILGAEVEIVAAFQNISHEHLLHDDPVDCDVLVCGTSAGARKKVLDLVAAAGLVGWDAGPIENAMVIEGLTSVLIGINKKYGSTHAGIRITGVNRE